MIPNQAGKACRGNCRAVICSVTRNDLLLLSPPSSIVVIPDKLYGGIGRLGARVGKKHSRQSLRRHLREPLCEQNDRAMRFRCKVMVGREAFELSGRSVHQALLAESQ